ncbi:M48 family metalloprotease [Streptomyces bobili]|uniref:M48 family metalloprotease n=1 Tax=Streptomyces bobili TaxID=67280 RepID=UPI0022572300|nr:M48 family metalloprotease [Streptomyces bobili]MCX5523839.1 M48 family metalloprotease [Streptomyces bobili]
MTLTPQQRVAVVAHELGHFTARDIRRGALIGAALSSSAGRAELTARGPGRAGAGSLSASPVSRHTDEMATASARFEARGRTADLALWLPRLVVQGANRLLMRLSLPNARRTEFQADAVAARVASTEAAVSALRDRLLADAMHAEVHRLAVTARTLRSRGAARSTDRNLWAEVAAHAAALPRHTGDAFQAEEGGLGLPSVGSRIARLRLGADQPAVLTLDAYRADAIEDELRVPRGLLARKVIQDCVHA